MVKHRETISSAVKQQGAGVSLREARERQNISRSWVADHLHLRESVVEAIELERYDQLPVPVFVRGYIRTYAVLLGLDVDSIVSSYVATLVLAAPDVPVQKAKFSAVTLNLTTAWVAFLMVVFSMLSGWYFTLDNEVDHLAKNQLWSAIGTAEAATLLPTEGTTLRRFEKDSIVFQFTGDSWIKVRDNEGKSVLRGLMTAGTIHVLSGAAPFAVTLGNSAGVVITKNGKVYNHLDHVRGNVAHFELDF